MTRLSRADLDYARAKGRISAAEYRRLVNEDRNVGLMFPKPTTTPKERRSTSLGAMRVRKGKSAERELASRVQAATGERVLRTPSSGGIREIAAGDLMGQAFLPGHVLAAQLWECKSANQVKFQAWWRQTVEEAASEGKIPVLAIRNPGGEWTVTVRMDDWLARFNTQTKTAREGKETT